MLLLVAGQHRRLVVAVVEVLQLGEAVDALGQGSVTLSAQSLGQGFALGLGLGFLHGRITTVQLEPADLVDGDVDMVDAVEPSAPEPVEVDAAGVFHRAEEVGRCGSLEHPAAGVGLEGVVERLASEHVLAEDLEGGGRLTVSIGSEVDDGFGISHRGHPVLAAHVVDQPAAIASGFPLVFPFCLGEGLEERVEPFVHPRPLAFVAIDDHREVVVADLVDDDSDERVFRPLGVGAVRFGPRAVEADHGIFHAADGAVD